MRKNGTKYPTVIKYDPRMVPVSEFAEEQGIAVGQVYIKYDRHIKGYQSGTKGPYPGYKVVQFNKMNFVIPD